ncbi:MAG: nickel pincer cofactor biosynthesis protein LarC [Thermomicrobiales bacterium]
MRIAYLDPFSGASGDMVLGALIDAGVPLDTILAALAHLPLDGYRVVAEEVSQHGIHGTRVSVLLDAEQPSRDWAAIRALIAGSTLDPVIARSALAVFARLAEAEAAVHAVPVDSVHFHEVGGVDAIVDICGACAGFAALGVETIYSGPPAVGSGFVRAAHGLLPVPAPATAELLARASAPFTTRLPPHDTPPGELLTPTGAAILTTLARPGQPSIAPVRVGYGFGQRELPWPNALRLYVGEAAAASSSEDDGEVVLEANIDDLDPRAYELLSERLFAAGALDVWLTPIQMKKGRPAITLAALAPAALRPALADLIVRNTTTLGVRATTVDRTKAARLFRVVVTRWGDVRVKLRAWQGRVIDAAPEYDDCLAIARAHDLPLRDVTAEAQRLGESYSGRRLADLADDPLATASIDRARATRAPNRTSSA